MRSRKKGKPKFAKHLQSAAQLEDSNMPMLLPKIQEIKETAGGKKIHDEREQNASGSRISSKKKRRLEKYIEKKLDKEERIAILENLACKQTFRVMDRLCPLNGKTCKAQRSIPPLKEEVSENWHDGLDSCSSSSRSSGVECIVSDYEGTEWKGFMHQDDGREQRFADDGKEKHSSPVRETKRRKTTGFKDWAHEQLAAAKNYHLQPAVTQPHIAVSASTTEANSTSPHNIKGPLGDLISLPSTAFAKHVHDQGLMWGGPKRESIYPNRKIISIQRPEILQAARLLLPIVAEEQTIMEAILLHPVTVICGETGSGKTTQVPQFLYEAGFGTLGSENPGMIGITQPRRVAAMSMASRVATELSLPPSRVSYRIRYDATVTNTTSIKFMTDGVLLRELATDLLLSQYSVIILDEAHERSLNTDILVGLLSRIVRLREELWREAREGVKPLRLIIMSATLRVSDFTSNPMLFHTPPPVINISARQHPVTIHFARRTVPDYVSEAVRKTVKIHARLPPGGILIFLTGQDEIKVVCKKLKERFGRKAISERKRRQQHPEGNASHKSVEEADDLQESVLGCSPTQVDIEAEDMELGSHSDVHLSMDMDDDIHEGNTDALDSDQEGSDKEPVTVDLDGCDVPMHVVPLYSLLPSDRQRDVFLPPPSDSRLVVVATNIAETSLTIPGIRYVVDCGRAKERKYDVQTGVQSFQVSWISKASAAQRAGRAGRTGPGHCYRLYSSALFEHHLEDFALPEILRVPIEGIVLQMKSMNIDNVVNFPFPTAPDRMNLKRAEAVLRHLGALRGTLDESHVTDLGRTMALFPLSPRFSKMLMVGRQQGCLPFVVAIVSGISVGDPFLHEESLIVGEDGLAAESALKENTHEILNPSTELNEKKASGSLRRAYFASQQAHGSLGGKTSDIFRMLSVVGAYEYSGGGPKFCADHFVRPKAMDEIHRLRHQIAHIVQANFPDTAASFREKMRPPNDVQLKILRQLITAGFVDQVAVRKDLTNKSRASGNKYSSSRGVPYKAPGVLEDVFIHPSSLLYHVTPPEYVVFHEIVRTTQPWIKTLTVINPAWLSKLGPTLCALSKPLKSSAEGDIVIPRYGPDLWELPPIKLHDVE